MRLETVGVEPEENARVVVGWLEGLGFVGRVMDDKADGATANGVGVVAAGAAGAAGALRAAGAAGAVGPGAESRDGRDGTASR